MTKTKTQFRVFHILQKKLRKTNWIFFNFKLYPGSDSDPDPDPLFPEVDLQIWIQINMKWIRNTGCAKFTLRISILKKVNKQPVKSKARNKNVNC